MTSRSQTRSQASEVVTVVYRNLQTALTDLCSDRYEVPLSLMRSGEATEDAGSVHVQIERRGIAHLAAEIRASHVGGNIYDVHCAVEDGPSKKYSYSLPEHANPSRVQASRLGETLAGFLLDELERRVGRQQLRRSAAHKSAPARGPSAGGGRPPPSVHERQRSGSTSSASGVVRGRPLEGRVVPRLGHLPRMPALPAPTRSCRSLLRID